MQLDRTFIKIRERNIFEITDIALKVFRRYFLGILLTGAICTIPFALLNLWVIYPLLDTEYYDYVMMHIYLMTCLVFLQSSLATAPISQLLGTCLFEGKIDIAQTLKHSARHGLRLLWLHCSRRTVLWTLFVAWIVRLGNYGQFEHVSLTFFLTGLVVMLEMLIRALRPYGNEIILLEQAPFSKRSNHQINYSSRSKNLHGPSGGMLFSRSVAIGFVAIIIGVSFYVILIHKAVIDAQWRPTRNTLIILFPMALWLAAIMMAIIRFLSYIDLRTRQEGWDIELRIRAEANRLMERYQPHNELSTDGATAP